MFFGARPKLISFEDARAALLTLLGDVGEEFWREKLAGVSRDSFGRILGGMGSFTDLVICREKNHQITEEKEPLANQLLSCLTSVCYVTSKRGAVNPVEAVAACGTTGLVLSGWRCLVCGYSQVSHYNIRGFLAAIWGEGCAASIDR